MHCYDPYSHWRPVPKPSENDFELVVVSKHPDFNGRAMKKYAVDGINTVGVWGNEPFEVHFKNNSAEDVQVRISLDGTDVLTGKEANLEVNHDMWVVRSGRTLHLKAWAENSHGGARFVFTGEDMGVALNSHGNVSHKGIISAAVFTERDRPVRPYPRPYGRARLAATSGHHFLGAAPAPVAAGGAVPAAAFDAFNADMERSVDGSLGLKGDTKTVSAASMKKSAAVGAGEYVEQRTRKVEGLKDPVLNSIVRVRYMWWDDLNTKLRTVNYEDPHPTGFPGEKIRTFADLSGVPRVTSVAATRVEEKAKERSFERGLGAVSPPDVMFDRF